MKIVHISDHHGMNRALPWGDLYLVTGDMLPNSDHYFLDPDKEVEFQEQWIKDNPYTPHLENQEAPVIVLRGNHDFVDLKPLFPDMNVTELGEPEEFIHITHLNLKIGGFRGVRWINGAWMDEHSEEGLNEICKRLAPKLDIVLTHAPPKGILDRCYGGDHPGCEALVEYITMYQPRLVCCGHIHEARGVETLWATTISNAATTINVIYLDDFQE